MNSNWSYSPETHNLGQNRQFFVPCDLEIWRMTLRISRAPLLCCFKLCASFHSHQWIQTGVTVRKPSIRVKIRRIFVPCDLEIWRMTLKNNKSPLESLLLLLQTLCIISKPWVNSNWSYSPETPNLGQNRRFFSRVTLKLGGMTLKNNRAPPISNQALCIISSSYVNYTNPGYGLSLVDTLWNTGSCRQPLEQEGNPMT